ncbi:hypothetical protein NMG60_11024879 [Bertholletia excelsa]
MIESSTTLLVSFLLISCANEVKSDVKNPQYKAGDRIPFYANKVGPFRNPSETYAYYDLPFCSSDTITEKKETIGEVLNGDHLVSAPYKIDFLVDKTSEIACKKKLKKTEISRFLSAVAQGYYTLMYLDDLPVWTFIGKVDRDDEVNQNKYHLFTHILFEIHYNNEYVIEINAQAFVEEVVELEEEKDIEVGFSYSVKWKETDTPFEKRMEKYSQFSDGANSIHWFSIMNSWLTVLITLGCLMMFYERVLKKDINKYAIDEELADSQEETGWKNIHGDVFRYPKHKSLLAAAVGSGTQLLFLMLCIIMLGLVGVFHPCSRGTLLTALVIFYVITSVIAGYAAVSLYCQLEGINWVKNLLLTGCLFVGPLFLIFCFLNNVAITYGATEAVSEGMVLMLISIWLLLALPLLLLGGISANSSKPEFQAPCPTTKYPREIPSLRWYRGVLPQMIVGGMLPYHVVYVELYYLFVSIWGHRIYTIYAILFITAIIVVIETAFVTLALTYTQLAAEDHEWWWRSFLCGGSTSFFIFGYCLYYYVKSEMSGLLQTSFFFGYMACICYGIFLMLGAIGFRASLLFIRCIYGSIKCE